MKLMSLKKIVNAESAVGLKKDLVDDLQDLNKLKVVIANRNIVSPLPTKSETFMLLGDRLRQCGSDKTELGRHIKDALESFYGDSIDLGGDVHILELHEVDTLKEETVNLVNKDGCIDLTMSFNVKGGRYAVDLNARVINSSIFTKQNKERHLNIIDRSIEAYNKRIDMVQDIIDGYRYGLYKGDVEITIE